MQEFANLYTMLIQIHTGYLHVHPPFSVSGNFFFLRLNQAK